MATTTTEVPEAPSVGESITFFCCTYGGGKFWAVVRKTATTFSVEWGAAGARKQRKQHACLNAKTCERKINNLIKSKLKKNYTEF